MSNCKLPYSLSTNCHTQPEQKLFAETNPINFRWQKSVANFVCLVLTSFSILLNKFYNLFFQLLCWKHSRGPLLFQASKTVRQVKSLRTTRNLILRWWLSIWENMNEIIIDWKSIWFLSRYCLFNVPRFIFQLYVQSENDQALLCTFCARFCVRVCLCVVMGYKTIDYLLNLIFFKNLI